MSRSKQWLFCGGLKKYYQQNHFPLLNESLKKKSQFERALLVVRSTIEISHFFQRSTSDVGYGRGPLRGRTSSSTGQTQPSSVYVLKMAGNKSYTIVEYFGGDDGYRCGYCKNEKGNFSHGKCFGKRAKAGLTLLVSVNWFRLPTSEAPSTCWSSRCFWLPIVLL